ncbi:TPA: hypothetical protein ACXDFY_003940 [Enterobacter roggenkampii]
MSIYAIVNDDGVIINTVSWDGEGDLFDGVDIVNVDGLGVGIGWRCINGKFTPPDYPDDSGYLL